MIILETSRLYLREILTTDDQHIRLILQDADVMYAWEHTFSDEEVARWIDENIIRYERDGYSYWAVIEKTSGKLIGVTGLIAEKANHENHVGVGYIYNKLYWGNGYAHEAAAACCRTQNKLMLTPIKIQQLTENLAKRFLHFPQLMLRVFRIRAR